MFIPGQPIRSNYSLWGQLLLRYLAAALIKLSCIIHTDYTDVKTRMALFPIRTFIPDPPSLHQPGETIREPSCRSKT